MAENIKQRLEKRLVELDRYKTPTETQELERSVVLAALLADHNNSSSDYSFETYTALGEIKSLLESQR
jgi:hypothetical protein